MLANLTLSAPAAMISPRPFSARVLHREGLICESTHGHTAEVGRAVRAHGKIGARDGTRDRREGTFVAARVYDGDGYVAEGCHRKPHGAEAHSLGSIRGRRLRRQRSAQQRRNDAE